MALSGAGLSVRRAPATLFTMKKLGLALAAALVLSAMAPLALAARGGGEPARPGIPSSMASGVTVYGASWCGPCKALERGLRERDIPFEIVDVDRNPDAHERAKQATGTSAIPVTSVARGAGMVWIVGADVGAVERAYRGN